MVFRRWTVGVENLFGKNLIERTNQLERIHNDATVLIPMNLAICQACLEIVHFLTTSCGLKEGEAQEDGISYSIKIKII